MFIGGTGSITTTSATPYNLVDRKQSFGGACYIYLQVLYIKETRKQQVPPVSLPILV